MKYEIGLRQQWCMEVVLTKAEAQSLAAAIRPKQNGLATAVKLLLAKWAQTE